MQRKMLNKVAKLLLVGMLFFAFPMNAMAESQENSISPRFTYIVDAENILKISGSTATVSCWVNGQYQDATKAKVIAELQVKSSATNWIPVAIWTDTQDGYRAAINESHAINPNNTYRVKATFTVWEGTQSETITMYNE